MKIDIYDTTLRDGGQAEDVNFSAEDKLRVAQKLDELGVDYVEGGWPGSNPTDRKFFRDIQAAGLKRAKLAAFGATRRAKLKAEDDPSLQALVASGAPVATIFGKSWTLHVREALRVDLPTNLAIISDSIGFLRQHFREVFFDAEHFFDGFKDDPGYAVACLRAAHDSGADALILCDTNGGSLPSEVVAAIDRVKADIPSARLGIHAHNDSELAVANSVAAVQAGCVQVQGTINGYGERCGNANLTSIIPVLSLKLGHETLPDGKLAGLTGFARFMDETANIQSFARQPFVGRSAFAHKAGVHVSAIRRNARAYEHMDPALVGNAQRVVGSDLSGKSNILALAEKLGLVLAADDPRLDEFLARLKNLYLQGFEYSAAEASMELLLRGAFESPVGFFAIDSYRTMNFHPDGCAGAGEETAEAAVKVVFPDGKIVHTIAEGNGPVNAMDHALRKALVRRYASLREMRLVDYKVRVMPRSKSDDKAGDKSSDKSGTGAVVRVLIESSDGRMTWTTIGVSPNIIEASRLALEDAVTFKLLTDQRAGRLSFK